MEVRPDGVAVLALILVSNFCWYVCRILCTHASLTLLHVIHAPMSHYTIIESDAFNSIIVIL